MVGRTIALGERIFGVPKLTLGTIRRVPNAFQQASKFASEITEDNRRLPNADEFQAMLDLVFDGINATALNARPEGTLPISRPDFDAMVDSADFMDGIKFLADGVTALLLGRKRDGATSPEGNIDSSES